MSNSERAARRGPHRLVNAKTHALEPVQSTAPPYAILSHTWCSEEVTLQDWQAGTKQDSEGYHKVLGTCERALHDGIDYVWVDTCCIDKINHVELSEAINSMFQWYQDAEVCYVLLSDLELRGPPQQDEPEEEDAVHTLAAIELDSFIGSRYFKRGWTLQELLAARVVQIFASDGTYLGSLRRLAEAVAQATGIDVSLLSGEKSLGDFTIPQKISWASSRRTTKIEDRAYSLLGLLNVSLDLRYGDGEQEFVRLQKEVLKQAQGIHVLAWDRTDGSRRQRLLADSPDDFNGSAHITADRSVASCTEIWETNVGLKGSVPMFQCLSGDGETKHELVVLDCYEVDWPDKILALRVRRLRGRLAAPTFTVDAAESAGQHYFRLRKFSFHEYMNVRSNHATLLWDGLSNIKHGSGLAIAEKNAPTEPSPPASSRSADSPAPLIRLEGHLSQSWILSKLPDQWGPLYEQGELQDLEGTNALVLSPSVTLPRSFRTGEGCLMVRVASHASKRRQFLISNPNTPMALSQNSWNQPKNLVIVFNKLDEAKGRFSEGTAVAGTLVETLWRGDRCCIAREDCEVRAQRLSTAETLESTKMTEHFERITDIRADLVDLKRKSGIIWLLWNTDKGTPQSTSSESRKRTESASKTSSGTVPRKQARVHFRRDDKVWMDKPNGHCAPMIVEKAQMIPGTNIMQYLLRDPKGHLHHDVPESRLRRRWFADLTFQAAAH